MNKRERQQLNRLLNALHEEYIGAIRDSFKFKFNEQMMKYYEGKASAFKYSYDNLSKWLDMREV